MTRAKRAGTECRTQDCNSSTEPRGGSAGNQGQQTSSQGRKRQHLRGAPECGRHVAACMQSDHLQSAHAHHRETLVVSTNTPKRPFAEARCPRSERSKHGARHAGMTRVPYSLIRAQRKQQGCDKRRRCARPRKRRLSRRIYTMRALPRPTASASVQRKEQVQRRQSSQTLCTEGGRGKVHTQHTQEQGRCSMRGKQQASTAHTGGSRQTQRRTAAERRSRQHNTRARF